MKPPPPPTLGDNRGTNALSRHGHPCESEARHRAGLVEPDSLLQRLPLSVHCLRYGWYLPPCRTHLQVVLDPLRDVGAGGIDAARPFGRNRFDTGTGTADSAAQHETAALLLCWSDAGVVHS